MRVRSTIWKWLAGVLAAVLLGAWWWLRAALPPLAGELQLPGLQAPVSIVRDAHAVPHIRAQSAHDAWFALGVVHAQDRLWQMEMNRRIAGGRLSEIAGGATLDTDRFLRSLGLQRVAARNLERLDADSRAVLDAYAAGVNAWLQAHDGPLPLEFQLLGVQPQPWTPVDALAWLKVMALDLSANWSDELLRLRLSSRLTSAQIQEFLPPTPYAGPLPVTDYVALYHRLEPRLSALGPAVPEAAFGLGSNNWVVDGRHTTSGKPLLANDPHLALSAPGIWYLAHLQAPGLNVIGATLPGVPLVVIGRNQRIAWGMTNTKPDTQDLYIERIDPADPTRYLAPDGARTFSEREELIEVRGAEAVPLRVRETRHGPLLPDARVQGTLPPGYALALRWTALDDDDPTFRAGLRMLAARDWDSFVDALRDFRGPQQNFVYADVDGHIGFIAPGRVPLRKPENDLLGLAPAPGWDARYDWDGYIPFEALPRRLDPPAGRISSANDRIVAADYPYYLTAEWAPPYRGERIAAWLSARARHDVEDFMQLQGDQRSGMAAEFLPRLLALASAGDADTRAWLQRLRQWDAVTAADRAEPLVFVAWLRELSRLIYADELGEMFAATFELRPTFLANVLDDRDGQARWCDDIGTPRIESCAEQVSAALPAALADLRRRYGSDERDWRWGAAHPAVAEHRPFSHVAWLKPLFELRTPVGGDTYTVDVARHFIGREAEPFAATHAASLRMIVDLAAPDASRFVIAGGQSGQRLSPYYADQWALWATQQYLPMSMREADYRRGAVGELRLSP